MVSFTRILHGARNRDHLPRPSVYSLCVGAHRYSPVRGFAYRRFGLPLAPVYKSTAKDSTFPLFAFRFPRIRVVAPAARRPYDGAQSVVPSFTQVPSIRAVIHLLGASREMLLAHANPCFPPFACCVDFGAVAESVLVETSFREASQE